MIIKMINELRDYCLRVIVIYTMLFSSQLIIHFFECLLTGDFTFSNLLRYTELMNCFILAVFISIIFRKIDVTINNETEVNK